MSHVSIDAGKPLVGRVTPVDGAKAKESETAPKISRDEVSVGGDRAALSSRIDAAFDKRAKAQGLITSRMIQLYVGWNPRTDVAYQQAIKDRLAANEEISRYRKLAPDLVRAEEARRTLGAQAGNLFRRFFAGIQSIFQAVPWQPWGPFIRPEPGDERRVILS